MDRIEFQKLTQSVRELRNSIGLTRVKPGITRDERGHLDEIYQILDGLEEHLILEEIHLRIKNISASAQKLAEKTKSMEASAASLGKIVQNIKDVSTVVQEAVRFFETTSSFG